jgi:hypothetical protein
MILSRIWRFQGGDYEECRIWVVAPCSSCVNRRFRGTYRLLLQGRKICEQGTSVSRWLVVNVGSHKIDTAPHPRRRQPSSMIFLCTLRKSLHHFFFIRRSLLQRLKHLSIKFSRDVSRINSMKTYGGSGSIAAPFLTSALDGSKSSASRPGRFIPRYPGIHWIGGWVGPGAGLDAVEKREILPSPGI